MSIVLIYNMTPDQLQLTLNAKPIGTMPPEEFASGPALHPLVVLRDTTDEPFDNMFGRRNRLVLTGGAAAQTYEIDLDPAEFDPEQNVALTLFPRSAMLAGNDNHRELTPLPAARAKPKKPASAAPRPQVRKGA